MMTILELRAIKLSKSCFNSYIIFNPINMRNIKIVLLSIGMISFMACSSDDDNLKNANCYDCAANLLTIPFPVGYCDNGDGTAEVTTLGMTETVDLQGVSFEDFMTTIKAVTTCSNN